MRGMFKQHITAVLLLWSAQLFSASFDASDVQTSESKKIRVVVLEYSFIDALQLIGISPIAIADDNQPDRILPQIRQHLSPWVSVGLRSQPNLELISKVKPDIILADSKRHSFIFDELNSIAPTLLLDSLGAKYEDIIESARRIGVALSYGSEMDESLRIHSLKMKHYKDLLLTRDNIQFAVSTSSGVWLHTEASYAGSVLKKLGLNNVNISTRYKSIPQLEVNLEYMLSTNPDWLFISHYSDSTVFNDWANLPIFDLMSAKNKNQIVNVSPSLWSFSRGIIAAEEIAKELIQVVANDA